MKWGLIKWGGEGLSSFIKNFKTYFNNLNILFEGYLYLQDNNIKTSHNNYFHVLKAEFILSYFHI